MGYYADTNWDITFKSEQDRDECLRKLQEECTWDIQPDYGLLSNVGEMSDEEWDGLNLTGSTCGKFYGEAEAERIIAAHATGGYILQGDSGMDDIYEAVLDGRGGATYYSGDVVFKRHPRTAEAISGALRERGVEPTPELVDAIIEAL